MSLFKDNMDIVYKTYSAEIKVVTEQSKKILFFVSQCQNLSI